jgi:hypothetical protein
VIPNEVKKSHDNVPLNNSIWHTAMLDQRLVWPQLLVSDAVIKTINQDVFGEKGRRVGCVQTIQTPRQ